MPTRRRRSRKSSSNQEPSKLATGAKNLAKKGIEGYLKGTQKLADKIEGALPESAKRPRPSKRRRRRTKRVGDMM